MKMPDTPYDQKENKINQELYYSTAELIKKLKVDVKRVTFRQLVRLWGCTDTFLHECMSKGLPHEGRGMASVFDLELCQKWYRGELN
jgi:hypothetical protein